MGWTKVLIDAVIHILHDMWQQFQSVVHPEVELKKELTNMTTSQSGHSMDELLAAANANEQTPIQSSFSSTGTQVPDLNLSGAALAEYLRPSALDVGDEIVLTIKSFAPGRFEGIAVDLHFDEVPDVLQVSTRNAHVGRLIRLWGPNVREWIGKRLLIRVVEVEGGDYAGQNTFVLDSGNADEQLGERVGYRPSRQIQALVKKKPAQ